MVGIVYFVLLVNLTHGYLVEISIGVFIEVNSSLQAALPSPLNVTPTLMDCNVSVTWSQCDVSGVSNFQKRGRVSRCVGENNITASVRDCDTTKIIAETLHDSQFLLDFTQCAPDANNIFSVGTRKAKLAEIISDIGREEGWSDLLLFVDHISEHETTAIIDNLSSSSVAVTTTHCDDIAFMKRNRHLLQHLSVFVVLCHPGITYTILEQARMSDLGLLGPYYFWVLIDPGRSFNRENLLQLLVEGDNILLIQPDSFENYENHTISLLNETMYSIGTTISDVFENVSSSNSNATCVDLNMTTIIQNSLPNSTHRPQYSIWTYSQGTGDQMVFMSVATWQSDVGLLKTYHLFPMVHQGFNNRQFLVTAIQRYPFTVKLGEGNWTGLCFEVVDELARVLNFSYIVVEPPEDDQHFGIRINGTGNFNGMIGMLQRKEVDFAVGHFSVIEERQLVADFTPSFLIDHYIILMRRPDLAQSQLFICFGPFTARVWFCLAASVILIGSIYYLISRMHPLYTNELDFMHNWSMSTLQIFGAMMQQGMAYAPVFSSGRVLVGLWWFYTIVVVATYNGNLIAFLTAPKVVVPINTISDLVESNYGFGTTKYAALHGVLKDSDHPDMVTLWNRIKDNQDYYLMDNELLGIKKAHQDSDYAFLLEESYFTSLRSRIRNSTVKEYVCDFVRAEEYFFQSIYAFPFQKHSPYIKLMSVGLLRIIEAGLMERWKRKWSTSVTPCNGLERTAEQTNISLAEAQGAFYVLGIGLMCSFLSLLLERIFNRYIVGTDAWEDFKRRLKREKKVVSIEDKAYAAPAPRSYPPEDRKEDHEIEETECQSDGDNQNNHNHHSPERKLSFDDMSVCSDSTNSDLAASCSQVKTVVVHDCRNVLLRSKSCTIHLNDNNPQDRSHTDSDSGIASDVTTIKSHRVLIEVNKEENQSVDNMPMKITIIGCIDGDDDGETEPHSIVTYL